MTISCSFIVPDLFDGTNKNDDNDNDEESNDEDVEDINPIELAAALESRSAHPLANAIVSCKNSYFFYYCYYFH